MLALIAEQKERLATLRSRVSRYRSLLRAERDTVKALRKEIALLCKWRRDSGES